MVKDDQQSVDLARGGKVEPIELIELVKLNRWSFELTKNLTKTAKGILELEAVNNLPCTNSVPC